MEILSKDSSLFFGFNDNFIDVQNLVNGGKTTFTLVVTHTNFEFCMMGFLLNNF